MLHDFPMFIGGLVLILSCYVLYSYFELKGTRLNTDHVLTLNHSTQELRQSLSAAIYYEENELSQLEREVQHFRYLLLKTKSHAINQHSQQIQDVLLEADNFIEDVDHLLVSIYSVTQVARQLSDLLEAPISIELREIIHDISSFLLFEMQGRQLNQSAYQQRFNVFMQALEIRIASNKEQANNIEIFALYTALERFNHQAQAFDDVMNHRFISKMNRAQAQWTDRLLSQSEQMVNTLLFIFVLSGLQFLFKQIQNRVRSSRSIPIDDIDIKAPMLTNEPNELETLLQDLPCIFDHEVLNEQLDACPDSIDAVLTMFVVEHQNDMTLLREYLHQQDYEKAHHLTHKLKGVSGNIGALALATFCRHLDDAFRMSQKVDDNCLNQAEMVLKQTIQHVTVALEQLKKSATA